MEYFPRNDIFVPILLLQVHILLNRSLNIVFSLSSCQNPDERERWVIISCRKQHSKCWLMDCFWPGFHLSGWINTLYYIYCMYVVSLFFSANILSPSSSETKPTPLSLTKKNPFSLHGLDVPWRIPFVVETLPSPCRIKEELGTR